jgi:AAA+ superfamily predicted ATPase
MNRSRFIQGLKSDIQLSEKERRRIIRNSIKKYPWKLKCTVAMEEFAELQQQVSKQIRGYGDKLGLLEEMADAYICLSFLESIFDVKPEDLQKAIDVKLQRERENCR